VHRKDPIQVIELNPTAFIAPTAQHGTASVARSEGTSVIRSLVRVQELLVSARVIWLSSVRSDGRPHIVPTWFDWDGEVITVFSRRTAQKVINVRHHPSVMVAIGRAEPEFDVELLEGEARVVDSGTVGLPAIRPSSRFAIKYAAALATEGRTLAAFSDDYPCAIRIHPTRLLDWGAREHTRHTV
jgi:PPOX class probable F420-dependent enzyme